MSEIKKEYSNGELTVVWKPKKCIHSEICVKTLPNVYKPDEKPWIQVENASTDELKAQIKKCPSGALSFYMNDGSDEESNSEATKAEIMKDGPLLVHGKINVVHPDGNTESKENVTAFCRCGQSTNKPYCDGTHNKVGFKG